MTMVAASCMAERHPPVCLYAAAFGLAARALFPARGQDNALATTSIGRMPCSCWRMADGRAKAAANFNRSVS
jgi:hypothetical protein